MSELNLSSDEPSMIRQKVIHEHAQRLRQLRKKQTIFDYEPIAIIGRGAFGEVRVVRHIVTGEIMAMKKMKKSEMKQKNQVHHVRAERNVLAMGENDVIVGLKCSFQDSHFLYLGMESSQVAN